MKIVIDASSFNDISSSEVPLPIDGDILLTLNNAGTNVF